MPNMQVLGFEDKFQQPCKTASTVAQVCNPSAGEEERELAGLAE